MQFSDWKNRVRALFRPTHHQAGRAVTPHRTTEATNVNRKPVEIHIASTGERFVHAPSLAGAGAASHAADEKSSDHDDNTYAQHVAVLEHDAAESLERWDGKSVRDIATESFHEFPHLESHPTLQATVPSAARHEHWNPNPLHESFRSSITLLAIDESGEALVRKYSVDDLHDADGQSYNVMPIDEASKLLQGYGGPDLKLDVADSLWDGSVPVQSPVIGATYRGEILSIEGDTAYQMAGEHTTIAHNIGTLVITDFHQYVGKEVEISYPCGQVGLVRQVDAMAHDGLGLQKPGAEKAENALER